MYQHFVHLHGKIILQCVYILYLLIQSIVDRHLGGSNSLTIVNRTAMNIGVQAFVWIYIFNSFEYVPRNGISGSYWGRLLIGKGKILPLGINPPQQKFTPSWTPPCPCSLPPSVILSNSHFMVRIAVANSPKRQGNLLACSEWKMVAAQ
jgi:hypothetical protein